MSRPRLHWFGRAALAAVAAGLYGGLVLTFLGRASNRLVSTVVGYLGAGPQAPYPSWQIGVSVAVVHFIPVGAVALIVYGLLGRWMPDRANLDHETRCRRCGYILRGLRDPRCPECGEPV